MTLTLRPRLAPLVMTAVMLTLIAYMALRLSNTGVPYPFGVAALLGCANLCYALWTRRDGLRLDDSGIADLARNVAIAWADVTDVRLSIEKVPVKNGQALVRIATIAAGERVVRFGDLGPGRPPSAGDIVNIEAAPLVLAIVAARTRAAALYPPSWTAAPEVPAAVEGGERPQLSRLGGVGAMGVKIGPKIVAVVIKLAKSIKLGSVALAIGMYSLIWSWKFALGLVGMIMAHECGHTYAMYRSGVPVKGIYFIPFFGGAAVSKGVAKTRARSAFIAINGPIWGTLLAIACLGAFAATGEPFLGTLAAWGALINLFNLFPMFPLDGGRIVASLAHASPRGVPIIAGLLVVGFATAYLTGFELLQIILVLGLFELGARLAAAPYHPGLALLGRDLTGEEHEHLAHHVAYVEQGRDAPAKHAARIELFAQRKAEAAQTPMTFRQGALVIAGYAALIGGLLAILFATAHIAGTGDPLSLLR